MKGHAAQVAPVAPRDRHARLEQTLRALPGIESSRRDSIKAAALFLDTLSRGSPPGEDVKPTTAKQAALMADLRDRVEQMLSAPDVERRRDAAKGVVDFVFSVSWTPPGEYVNPTTRKQAERDLLALRQQAGELRSLVGRMNKTALDAMGFGRAHLGRLVQVEMEAPAQRALERLRVRPGRPHLQHADWVTLIAAAVFTRLTGKLPTLSHREGAAYGRFFDFLTGVFEACDITASAERRAKVFIRKFCKPRREPASP